jgi:hypothetical protein
VSADIAPTLAVDPSEVNPGGTTTVTGEGYTPDSTATVQLTDADGNPVGDPIMVDTDENGAFTTPLVVAEDAELGAYTVVGTDDTTGTPAEAPLDVVSGTDPGDCTNPTLVADPTSRSWSSRTSRAGSRRPSATAADDSGMVHWTFTVPSDLKAGA